MTFPVSGVEVFPLFPPLIAFLIAAISSTAGITGAFLLLPVQISLFGFTSPAVTATNHLYNVFAGIGGPLRLKKEGRLVKPLFLSLIMGTVPGVICGVFIRVHLLPDPLYFKMFVGCVMVLLGFLIVLKKNGTNGGSNQNLVGYSGERSINVTKNNLKRFQFTLLDQDYEVNVSMVASLSFVVGIISGVYGMGGGSLNIAMLVAVFGLPIYATAGATMLATFVSSLTGVVSFTVFSALSSSSTQVAISPDWLLGSMFGIGGLLGTYFGAYAQKYITPKALRRILAILIWIISVKYILEYISHILR